MKLQQLLWQTRLLNRLLRYTFWLLLFQWRSRTHLPADEVHPLRLPQDRLICLGQQVCPQRASMDAHRRCRQCKKLS